MVSEEPKEKGRVQDGKFETKMAISVEKTVNPDQIEKKGKTESSQAVAKPTSSVQGGKGNSSKK
jgi:hypothetical protein